MTIAGRVGRTDGATSAPKFISRQTQGLIAATAGADLIALALAVFLAWQARLDLNTVLPGVSAEQALDVTAGPWMIGIWILLLGLHGAYSARIFAAGTDEFKTIVMGSVITAGVVGMGCYLLQIPLSRGFVLLSLVFGTVFLLLDRYAVRKVVHRLRFQGRYMHRVVAVGGPASIAELTEVLHRERYVGYEVVGACVPEGIDLSETTLPVPHLGRVEETRRVAERVGADTVLVAGGAYSSGADLRRIAWSLEGSALDLVVVPSLTDVAGPRIRMRPVAGLPLLHVEGPQADEATGLAKRIFDLVVATLLLLVLGPLLLLAALVVKISDGGPVLFRQERVGRLGESFSMLKFRSMTVGAEQRLGEVSHLDEGNGMLFKAANDPRTTRVGRHLRRFSIDEFPQLLNVLRGEMSLVGPRPPLPCEVARYGADVQRRLLVRPGMTGLWQVSGRSSLSWDETVRLDLYYVDNWSMVTDLVIMAKTARAVLRGSGAY